MVETALDQRPFTPSHREFRGHDAPTKQKFKANPALVNSLWYRETVENIVKFAGSDTIAVTAELKTADIHGYPVPQVIVHFPDVDVPINPKALSQGLGFGDANIYSLPPELIADLFSRCTFEGKRVPIYLVHKGAIVNPHTEKAPEKPKYRLAEWEKIAIEDDIKAAEADEIDYTSAFEFPPEYAGENTRTGEMMYDDGTVEGVSKRSPREIERWEKRNIEPKSRRKGHKPVIRRHYAPDENGHSGNDTRPARMEMERGTHFIARQQVNPWDKRKDLGSKLLHEATGMIQTAREKEALKAQHTNEREQAEASRQNAKTRAELRELQKNIIGAVSNGQISHEKKRSIPSGNNGIPTGFSTTGAYTNWAKQGPEPGRFR
jgi:hypothetical protein